MDQVNSEQEEGFTMAPESSGHYRSLGGSRDYLIDINGVTVNGQLTLVFNYSAQQYRPKTIQALVDNYHHHLKNLIQHCQYHYGYTPSDFGLAKLNQPQLDDLLRPYENNIETLYPLSPMQLGMLFHDRYQPDSNLYFEQTSWRVSGNIQPQILRQAWQFLVDRHPILRTAFNDDQLSPLQIVLKQVTLPWLELDWQAFTPAEQQQQLDTLFAKERREGFDLGQAPLMRMIMIQETSQSYRLVWNHHHILLDGWCVPILLNELFVTYAAMEQKQSHRLPPINRFHNYIDWLTQQDPQVAQTYWQQKLAGFTAPTPIPINSNSQDSVQYHSIQHLMTTEHTQSLNLFARHHRVTLNTLVQAAWAMLLGRYSGEKDVVFGYTTSGRNVPIKGIEGMLGLFINTLPLRVDLSQDIKSLLQALQNQQQQDNHYAYINLADIQNHSEVANGTPLFHSIFAFENYPFIDKLIDKPDSSEQSGKADKPGLPFQFDELKHSGQTNYPLSLAAAVPNQTLGFNLSFDSNLIDIQAAQRMLAHLQNLLLGIVHNPETKIQDLPLLTTAETQQLVQWNQTDRRQSAPAIANQTVVDLFQQQVEKAPNNIAVVFEEQQLSYGELNHKANQLAHYLRANHAIGADSLTAVCVERSLDMIIAVLGILKAGGAYVPLDPDYPQRRLSYMVQDSQAALILTQSNLQQRLPQTQAQIICLDTATAFDNQPGNNPAPVSGPQSLAYVIYTSGSTGNPKGVMIEHHTFVNLALWQKEYFAITPSSRILQFASVSFDAACWEWAMALSHGAGLYLDNAQHLKQPEMLLDLIEKSAISHATLPPAMLNIMPR
ncbi:MAG: condensation domain-containing protein, partial [Psychrosphaera sp.]|nr:condensation domain-containing protein [Psychrosphaera sp.]